MADDEPLLVKRIIRRGYWSEMTAQALRCRLQRPGVKMLFIEPESPRENGCIESFNVKLRDEPPHREIFYRLWEAKVLVERWRKEYNGVRPHRTLGYRPSAPQTLEPPPIEQAVRVSELCKSRGCVTSRQRSE